MKKIVPLSVMFFCILFNYTIYRDTKDVMLLTAPKSGAEVIPFIKTYVNLPTAILFASLCGRLCDAFGSGDGNGDKNNSPMVFYACVGPFLVFFLAFAFAVYPNASRLHPHGFIDAAAARLPPGFEAPLSIVRNWSFVLFYVMAEMWGSVVTSLLFWGFANEVTTVDEAKRYYPLFGMGANVALVVSGQYVQFVNAFVNAKFASSSADKWSYSLKLLIGATTVSGGILMSTYAWMQKYVVGRDNTNNINKQPATTKEKGKKQQQQQQQQRRMGLRKSVKFLLKSPYIRNLATLVVSYGMCINIVEVSWKAKLKEAFANPTDYSTFMGNFSSVLGTVTLLMMLLGRTVLSKFGWRTAALVTPSVMGITGLLFFALTMFGDSPVLSSVTSALGVTPLMLAVLVGAVQNVLSKSSKYALFDPCKEMAFIPLDAKSKTKGKAAIDVVGNPLGKSGGALVQQVLICTVGSLQASTPYLAVVLAVIVVAWYRAADSLAVQFENATAVPDTN